MSRATIYNILGEAFETEEEYWRDDATPERIVADILPVYAPDIKRGDLVDLGGIRQRDTYVWDGQVLHEFNDELSSELDESVYPREACISIDEFPTVQYYADAGFYHDLVWLNMTGYQKMVIATGYQLYNPDKKRTYKVTGSLYNTDSEWVPFLVSNDGGIDIIGDITDA